MDRSFKIPTHILDDLSSRFILNIPDEYKQSPIRLFFQIESAHWFYIDFTVPENQGLKAVGIKEFATQIFNHCPFLHPGADNCEQMLKDWKAYKLTVPTYGVILLDPSMSYVLLVQGFSKSWGFPKGKINEAEDPIKCAQRELFEETGCDVSDRINPNHFLEHTAGDQYCKLYIVPGVSLNTYFQSQSRNEIKAMQWFPVSYLPTHKKDARHTKQLLGLGPNSFFMIVPFMKSLKRWIVENPYDPHAAPERFKNEAQRAFAEKSLTQFQEILEKVNPAPAVQKSPVGRRRGRRGTTTGQSYNRGSVSPAQLTIQQEDQRAEDYRKLNQLKQSLDIKTAETKKTAILFDSEPLPFTPCKEWKHFKLDMNDIIKNL